MPVRSIFVVTVMLYVCLVRGITGQWFGARHRDRVLLRDVDAITLHRGQMTVGRRSAPIPQTECRGAYCYDTAAQPSTVQCINRGSDGFDVQWECKADLDSRYRFGWTEVNCEGYDHPDDAYIIKGSCGLAYTLELTESGREDHPQHTYGGRAKLNYGRQGHYYNDYSGGLHRTITDFLAGIFQLLMLFGIILFVFSLCRKFKRGACIPDAPPPYHHGPTDWCPSWCSRGGWGGWGGWHGWRGGNFWTGMMTGGMLHNLFSSRRNYYHDRPAFAGYHGDPAGYSREHTTYRRHVSSAPSTRTASGFAATRRR